MPVVDAEDKVVGVISEKDLFRALYPLYEDYVLEPHAYCNQEQREDEIESIRKQADQKPDEPQGHLGRPRRSRASRRRPHARA